MAMSGPGGYTDQQLEQLVREHLGRLVLRYLPVTAGVLVILLVITALPSVRPKSDDASSASTALHSQAAPAASDASSPAGQASVETAAQPSASGSGPARPSTSTPA